MYIESVKLTLYLSHATSLKDKRQVCRSVIDKTRQRFNVSIAEVNTQDIIQTLTIGIAVVAGDFSHAQNLLDTIIRFIEENSDAEYVRVEKGE